MNIKKRIVFALYKKKARKRGIVIAPKTEISISSVELGDYVNIAHHAQVSNSNIGKRSSIGRYSKIQYAHIGSYCSISWDVTIGAVEHFLNKISTHAFTYRKQFGLCDFDDSIPHSYVEIGNDVWVGCNTVIMPGVVVGNGAVIGAGAVVTHDVESYEIVGGVPAKHLGYRFEKKKRELLNYSSWWELEDVVIRKHLNLFLESITEDNNSISQLNEIVEKYR